jgi:hypothetical protein
MTADYPAVATLFTCGSSRMKHNTHNSKCVTSGSSVRKQRAAPGRSVDPSVAGIYTASFNQSIPPEAMNSNWGIMKEVDASVNTIHPSAAIYDISEIPDINIHPNSGSSFDKNSLYGDDDEASTTPHGHASSEVRRRSRHRLMSYPNTPCALPNLAPVSPLSKGFPYRRDKPGSGSRPSSIVNLGWAEFRDVDEDDREPEKRKHGHATGFPSPSYMTPTPPTTGTEKEKGREETQDNKSRASLNSPRPIPSTQRSQLNSLHTSAYEANNKTNIFDIYRSAKQIYTSGPKGEGQKAWKDIQARREQKRLLKIEQGQQQQDMRNKNKELELEKLLAKVHAAAAVYDPRSCSHQPEPSRSPSPERPTPTEPLGVRRRVSPLNARADSRHSSRDEMKGQGSGEHETRKGSDAYSASCFSVPVTASASVRYDATEVVIDRSKRLPPVPILDPAPRSRGDVGVYGISKKKRGLPPPPVYIIPVRSAMVREASNTTAPAPTPAKKKLGLPPPPVPPSSNPIKLVGPTQYSPTTEAKLQWFAGLDDRHSSRPCEKKDKKKDDPWLVRALGSFLDVEASAKPPSHETHADRIATRKQNQLKASISHPYATSCPGGSTANFSEGSGGVGGPNAAISLPPGVTRKSELQQYHKRKVKGKEKAEKHEPAPPPPPHAPHKEEPNDPNTDAKMKKWFDWFPIREGSGKSFNTYVGFRKSDLSLGGGRKRTDSDMSFACQGTDAFHQQDFAYTNSAYQAAPYPADPYQPGRPRAPPAAHYQEPGPSRQTGPRIYVSGEDATLVPGPLFTGGRMADAAKGQARAMSGANARDTRFYAPYDDVLSEYGR